MATMAISELIQRLQKIHAQDGDMCVAFAIDDDAPWGVDVNDVVVMSHSDNTDPSKSFDYCLIGLVNV